MKQQIGVYMKKEWIDKLKQIAREESMRKGEDISYLDVIKIALKEKYGLEDND